MNNRRRSQRSTEDEYDLRGPGEFAREAVHMVGSATLDALQKKLDERVYDIDALRVKVTPGGSLLGFGRRVIVPGDEIHVVNGHGAHNRILSKVPAVFGSAAADNRPIVYWSNRLTQVIGLRTVTFVVPIAETEGAGIGVLDKNRVPYTAEAFVVAKLNPAQALVASQRVGDDIYGLAATIREVTEAEMLNAAAQMSLEEVIHDRQILAERAKAAVDKTLEDLGYELSFIRIGELGGNAFNRLVEQAEAGVTRDTTKEINAAELITFASNQDRAQTVAEKEAETRKGTEAQRLAAEQAVRTSELEKQETVAAREHDLAVANANRQGDLAVKQHAVALKGIDLQKAEDLQTATAAAEVAALDQSRQKALQLDAAKADAARQDLIQTEELARQAKRAQSDAERLHREETAAALREREVQTTHAQAAADALEIETAAKTATKLKTAQVDAEAAQKEADAQIKRAEAKRAEDAAAGLALADVEERRVAIAEKQVAVEREKGLAEAEVAERMAKAEITKQQGLLKVELEKAERMAQLLLENPAMLDLERLKIEQTQALEIARIEAGTRQAIALAMAQNMKIDAKLFGGGDQIGNMVANLMALAQGAQLFGKEVPLVGNLLNGNGSSASQNPTNGLFEKAQSLMPFVKRLVAETDPTVFSTMSVSDLASALMPAVRGEKSAADALKELKQHATFRVIGTLPVQPFLDLLGISGNTDKETDDSAIAAAA